MPSPSSYYSQPYPQPYYNSSSNHANNQPINPQAIQTQKQMPTPERAATLIEEVRQLKVSSGNVEKTIIAINVKLTLMEERLKSLEEKVSDVEGSCEFISQEFEKQTLEISDTKQL